jgi:hydrogenase-4 component B
VFLFLSALGILLLGGAAALALGRRPRAATLVGAGAAVAACLLGLVAALRALAGTPGSLSARWPVPYGSFALEIDPLSGFFLVPIFGLSALAAVYGAGYGWGRGEEGRSWFSFDLLVASMALVVAARNGVLFLAAWEVMTLASYFLVTTEDGREEVRRAGWTYLVASHLGTAFLLALFALSGRGEASLDFGRLHAGGLGDLLFLLAVVGFGTKAGFVPFHVWLPEAHPAAPSHVSALMSGGMIKVGIYGLVRALTWVGGPAPWWGWLLLGIGLASGILGVLFALAQHDLKRLLAYSSVENVGIVAIGLGGGLLGLSYGSPVLAALGFAGALLHVANHALFKGLLFLAAGAVVRATHVRELDRLGGLLARMPRTGLLFLIGAVAICGLPPLNGFVGEFLILLGAYDAGTSMAGPVAVSAWGTIGGLALIGGLAVACFTKAFGIVFLGEARSAAAEEARDPGPALLAPMALLAAGCLGVGLLAPRVLPALRPVLDPLVGAPTEAPIARAGDALSRVVLGASALLVLAAGLAGLRRILLSGRRVERAGTWDCGYALPTPRMQYTASSFSEPLTGLFRFLLRTRRRVRAPQGLFPRGGFLATETPDVCREGVFSPLFAGVSRGLSALRGFQTGKVRRYVLYIALTLLALLGWKLG